jgi:hypothetical protein
MMRLISSSLGNSTVYSKSLLSITSYGDFDVESEAYREGRDGDAEDLSRPDDVDMDSTNDFDDYDIDQAEILLTKQEVEAFA